MSDFLCLPRRIGLSLLLLLLAGEALASRDPTQPPPGAASGPLAVDGTTPPPAPPQLQAILRGPQGTYAMLDGQRLRAGERHGDLRLLAIRARSVVIERQGQRSELFLSQPILTPRH